MPFSFSNAFNDLSKSNIINNPIYTAILIVFIVLIIIIFMFKKDHKKKSKKSFWVLLFRSGCYMLLPILTIIFAHYKSIEKEYDNKFDNKALNETINNAVDKTLLTDDLFDSTISGAFENKPVIPEII